MRVELEAPKGALNHLEFFEIIREAKIENRMIPLWLVYGLGKSSFISEVKISPSTTVETKNLEHCGSCDFISTPDDKYDDGVTRGDWCVDSFNVNPSKPSFNNHFVFANKIAADAYFNYCLNSLTQETAYQAHRAHMNEWDSLIDSFFDGWDDHSSYDDDNYRDD